MVQLYPSSKRARPMRLVTYLKQPFVIVCESQGTVLTDRQPNRKATPDRPPELWDWGIGAIGTKGCKSRRAPWSLRTWKGIVLYCGKAPLDF